MSDTDATPTPADATPPGRARRSSAAGAVVAVLVGLLGFALVVQIRSNTGTSQLDNARQDDLVRILSDLNAREERLRSEISTLDQTRSKLDSTVQGRQAALAEAKRRADELGILAGTLPAQGEGLQIRFIAGSQPIHAATVLEAVEELRGAGAEAMQIAGSDGPAVVRIGASTYFLDRDGGIEVDGHRLSGTYTVVVIGPAQTMRTALTIPGGVADTVTRDGGNVAVDDPAVVRVDALRPGGTLQYARPVP